jgi:peptidoglycan/LPS O-acetylase OafA/YrhL
MDALRGLAALSVVLYHLATWAPGGKLFAVNPFVRGHEAVILFFVLSGFVLALPFHAGRAMPYVPFAIRRVCRIYLPFLAAAVLALLLSWTIVKGPVPGGTAWLAMVWTQPLSWQELGLYATLIAPFDTYPLNPVTWSLVHEMRMSLVFPLVAIATRFVPWPALLVAGPALSALALALGAPRDDSPDLWLSLGSTAYYAGFFVVGALLARHHEALSSRLRATARGRRAAVLAAGLGIYLYSAVLLAPFHAPPWVVDWAIAAGTMTLMVAVMASGTAQRALRRRPLDYLGRVSYSLYLFHPLVVIAMMHLLHPWLSFRIIACLALPVILLVAHLAYHGVEVPSMRLGRVWSARWRAHPPAPVPDEADPPPARAA